MYKDETISDFLDQLSSSAPIPGGGAVCALNCALSAALVDKIVNITYKRKKNKRLLRCSDQLKEIREESLKQIDLDAENYQKVREAFSIKAETERDKRNRKREVSKASIKACETPFSLVDLIQKLVKIQRSVFDICSKELLSDFSISLQLLLAAINGVCDLIDINLENVQNNKFYQLAAATFSKTYDIVIDVTELLEKVELVQEDEYN